ncbi:MAG: hypothetical protein OSJ60_13065 [Lachnospiraceae bacterium]|nr:hypothetical protein [Lachnospiraceae bacterium]
MIILTVKKARQRLFLLSDRRFVVELLQQQVWLNIISVKRIHCKNVETWRQYFAAGKTKMKGRKELWEKK